MKTKATPLFAFFLLLFPTVLFAQTAGDYRSNVTSTGLWQDASSWERFNGTAWVAATAAPASTDGVITIQDGDSIRLTAAATIDQVRVASGGILSIFDASNPTPATVFTVADAAGEADIRVSGKLYISVGARLTGAGAISVDSSGLLFLRRQGVLGVATTVQPAGQMYIDEAPELQNALTNNGAITWFRNNLELSNGRVINNGSITLLTTGNSVVTNDAGTNLFHNTATGTLTRAYAGGTLFINAPFRNDGLVRGAGGIEVNSTYTNTGTYAPGNPVGKLTIDPTAFTPGGTKIAVEIADSFAVKGGNDTLHIAGSGTYNLSNTELAITGSAYAPVGTVYTIMTTTGTFSGTFKSAAYSEYYGELTISPKAVTIKKIKAGPAIVRWGIISASALNGQALVNWTTLQEVGTTNFVVEHSLNGTDFTTIGTAPAGGNSSATTQYSFTHTNPSLGVVNYYRIKHTDAEGVVTYSPVASVRINAQGVTVLIAPNPVRNVLQVDVQASNITIHITNSLGQTVRTWLPAPGAYTENVSNWASGVYYFAIYQSGKRIAVQKIVKLP